MKKFTVTIQFVVEAPERYEAWLYARGICQKHLRDLATVHSVSDELPNPNLWIAINEPIEATPREQLAREIQKVRK